MWTVTKVTIVTIDNHHAKKKKKKKKGMKNLSWRDVHLTTQDIMCPFF